MVDHEHSPSDKHFDLLFLPLLFETFYTIDCLFHIPAANMILIPRDDRYDLSWWERGNFSAIPAPPGLTSNYIDPPSKASWDIVTQAVCLIVTTLLVAMRNVYQDQGSEKSGLG